MKEAKGYGGGAEMEAEEQKSGRIVPRDNPDFMIPTTFGTDGRGDNSVTLDLTNVGSSLPSTASDIYIYSASAANPNGRRTGTDNRRGGPYTRATVPASLDGGSWSASTNFWCQVCYTDGSDDRYYQGNVTASSGSQDITEQYQG